MLSVTLSRFIYCYTECHFAECRYAECHGPVTAPFKSDRKIIARSFVNTNQPW